MHNPNYLGARSDRGFFGGGDPGEGFNEDFCDPCSHCGGEGNCDDGADPLGFCPAEPHRCHACGGSGRARDQVIW